VQHELSDSIIPKLGDWSGTPAAAAHASGSGQGSEGYTTTTTPLVRSITPKAHARSTLSLSLFTHLIAKASHSASHPYGRLPGMVLLSWSRSTSMCVIIPSPVHYLDEICRDLRSIVGHAYELLSTGN
jgi:hypothetical protein